VNPEAARLSPEHAGSRTVEAVLARVSRTRIVPVVSLQDPEDALPLAQAVLNASLDVIEITFRTPAAREGIRRIADRFPQMLVGAGTLLTPGHVEEAVVAGAAFGMAPGFNPDVVRKAQELGLVFVPGVVTPGEVEQAMAADCRILKFFPATCAGIAMLRSLTGVFGHTGVRFIPTGGLDLGNAGEWLGVQGVIAIGASWLVDPALIAAKDWLEIQRRTRAFLDAFQA
jgi:2-dehydro-3-deoxyphosphogluconate aldolase/(4S)-4-hydroxy-2-oxoglutarate aldolase